MPTAQLGEERRSKFKEQEHEHDGRETEFSAPAGPV